MIASLRPALTMDSGFDEGGPATAQWAGVLVVSITKNNATESKAENRRAEIFSSKVTKTSPIESRFSRAQDQPEKRRKNDFLESSDESSEIDREANLSQFNTSQTVAIDTKNHGSRSVTPLTSPNPPNSRIG